MGVLAVAAHHHVSDGQGTALAVLAVLGVAAWLFRGGSGDGGGRRR